MIVSKICFIYVKSRCVNDIVISFRFLLFILLNHKFDLLLMLFITATGIIRYKYVIYLK